MSLARRRLIDRSFRWFCIACALFSLVVLVALIADILVQGAGKLNWDFLSSFPSRHAERAGIKAAIWGTVWLMGLTTLIATPIGFAAAIYLEEYARRGRLNTFIEINIANLAGVPSIIYGILGLAIFVRFMGFGRSVLAGAMTMSLLILPVLIIAAREAIRAVAPSLREASYALGATRWQTTSRTVLPAALPGILTGYILATSRAIGETAPLIMIGALTYVAFVPEGPMDSFAALPIQIFNWASRPQEEFRANAAGGIIVLLAMLFALNSVAIFLRQRWHRGQ